MAKLSVKDVDIAGKRVLMRADFNVSFNGETGEITDDTRIRASVPTIRYILEQGGCLILMSHLGRPGGRVVPQLKMNKVAERLSEILDRKVRKLDQCVGERVEEVVDELKSGQVVLLENTRFYKEERKNDPQFSRKLARLGDVYVNDAFGTAHRSHASTVGVAKFLPAVAGLLMAKELEVLGGILTTPHHPFLAVLGGAKVSDKIGVLRNLLDRCQQILTGGGIAWTFLRSQGVATGKSLVEEEKVAEAGEIMEEAKKKDCQILLPLDVVIAPEIEGGVMVKIVGRDEIPPDWEALDIGTQTAKYYSNFIEKARTIFWNGPVGYFEIDEFGTGTREIAKKIARVQVSVVGGGDTTAALKRHNLLGKITHVSTGGGASLEFLEGRKLPGVAVLKDKK